MCETGLLLGLTISIHPYSSGLLSYHCIVLLPEYYAMKPEVCHDCNVVVAVCTGSCHKATFGADSDDKVSIMTIRGFQRVCCLIAIMMTSSNGNIVHVTGPLWGNHRSLAENPPHKGKWRGALMFPRSAPEQTVQQTIETLVIWDAILLLMTSL